MKSKVLVVAFLAGLAFAGASVAETIPYKYDVYGRLIQATYSNGRIVAYKYDAAGNRTEVVVVAGS
ncbi:hypothetical protein DMC18_18090 [Caulobacter sp. D5]|uniref:RHS repeat domain-containing protein n=1 Tax=Caulobacter sp. D5 TaxID=357400 RepID=UPI000D7399AF|nr:RHS repeat domain-containing protein [Caulobacter sp. D5]PXA88992.1 hypothetical protein DMC18_18090 [Caulobacter sp. D5]